MGGWPPADAVTNASGCADVAGRIRKLIPSAQVDRIGGGGAAVPGQNEEEKVGLLATRGRKIAAAIAAAFIASVGGGLGAWAFQAAKDKTTDVLDRSAPITVRVQRPGTFEPAWPGGETFVFPDSAGPGPQILTAADRAALARLEWDWAIRRGGVIGGPQIIRLQIRGKGDQEVAITRIAAKVVKRSEPVHGWFVQFGGGCGPGVIRIADIDLDSSDPSATDLSSDSGPERLHSLTVTRSDLEQVEVIARTLENTIDWEVEVYYSAPDGDGLVTVKDGDKPFRVTSEMGSKAYQDIGDGFERNPDLDGEGLQNPC